MGSVFPKLLSRVFLILRVACAFAFVSASGSEPLRLWNEAGEYSSNYDVIVQQIPSGTTLQVGPDHIVKLLRLLGMGNTTVIYEIEGGKAIRLAKNSGITELGVFVPAFLPWFLAGIEKVERSETPVVKVFTEESRPDRFLIVENLEPGKGLDEVYSLRDLIRGRIKDSEISARMERELLEDFAPKTWALRFVEDMRSEQVLYTHRGWVVADLSRSVKLAHDVSDATLFSAMGMLPIDWRIKLERRVVSRRKAEELRGTFLQVALAEARRCTLWFQGVMNY